MKSLLLRLDQLFPYQARTDTPISPWMIYSLLAYTAFCLTVLEYFGRPEFFTRQFPELATHAFGLYPHLWWAASTLILLLLVPVLMVRLLFDHRLDDYGFRTIIKKRHLLLYLGLLVAMLPIVAYTAGRPDFQGIYPFYRGAYSATTAQVTAWEFFYLSQFIAVEFFFRGFLLFGLERVMGRYAIWVAMLPYCMLHFHKPPLEAFAAIVAGLILGEVALRTRTLWGGVMVHVGVAGFMEFLILR
ncbi:MAG: CPBP family intramembrane metalloprotease [Gammaproteobacteria bacterium]|nr:CPBP family intramembrane metalloprotease [Gammaproteobacteria bacterium]